MAVVSLLEAQVNLRDAKYDHIEYMEVVAHGICWSIASCLGLIKKSREVEKDLTPVKIEWMFVCQE